MSIQTQRLSKRNVSPHWKITIQHSLHWSCISKCRCPCIWKMHSNSRLVQIKPLHNVSLTLSACIFHDFLLCVRFLFSPFFFFASENLFHRNKSSAFLLFAIVSCVCVRRLFKRAGNLLAFLYFSVVFSSKWASAHDHFYIFIAYMRQGTWLFAHAICIRSGLLGPLFGEQCKNGFLKVTNNARERN